MHAHPLPINVILVIFLSNKTIMIQNLGLLTSPHSDNAHWGRPV